MAQNNMKTVPKTICNPLKLDYRFAASGPSTMVIKDTVYFMASGGAKGNGVFKTADPKTGKWNQIVFIGVT